MDLSNLVLPDISAEPKIITCTIEGVLEEDDLRVLTTGVPAESKKSGDKESSGPIPEFLPVEEPIDLVRIRERHHSVARLEASGMRRSLIASITGYKEAYLSTLMNAPAMRELVDFYRIQRGAAAEVVTERLKTVGLKAIDKIEDKLEQEDVGVFELAAIAKLGLDRGGHGPTSKQHIVSENHLVDHAELKRLNDAALQRSAETIIPMSEVRKAIPAPADYQAPDAAKEGVANAGD